MSHALLISALTLASTALGAQAPAPDPVQRVSTPGSVARDRIHVDVDADGTTWVRGRTYKAAFASDSAAYIPFLGSDAPRNFPLALRVESVSIGGVDLEFEREVPAVLRGDAVEYERGPFRERYLLAPDSVEQTFEFDALPRRGELVIELSFATELLGCEEADGFLFAGEHGGVRYGRAFALHDDLAPTPIQSRLAPGRITLRAPGALVEGSVGRLVIDPVIATFGLMATSPDTFAPDTAYDETNETWFTIAEEVFSASDHDVTMLRHGGAGGLQTTFGYVDSSAEDWRSPAVANNNKDDQFLVVAARGAAPNRQIWARTAGATASLILSPKFLVSDGGFAGDCHSPDVGGDRSGSGDAYYCVVWQRDLGADNSDIHGRIVRTNGTGLGATTLFVDNSLATLHRNPSISNSNGVPLVGIRTWNIVWEHEASPGNRNILGRQVQWDGSFPGPTFLVASSALDERNPTATCAIEGNVAIRPWMVAYEVQNGANGSDVRCRTMDGASQIATFDLSAQFPSVALHQVEPVCETVNGQFVVVYEERPPGLVTTTDIRLSSLTSVQGILAIHEGNLSVSPGLNLDSRPRVAAQESSGSLGSDVLVVFDRDEGAHNDIEAARYRLPDGGPVTGYCFGDGTSTPCPCGNAGAPGNGCGSSVNPNGARLVASGAARVLGGNLVLTASGLPATATVLFFQGTAQTAGGVGSVFGDGLRCASGTVTRLGIQTAAAGSAQYPQAGDGSIASVGQVPAVGALRFYQAWYRNTAAFCTPSGFNLTNGLRVQWIH